MVEKCGARMGCGRGSTTEDVAKPLKEFMKLPYHYTLCAKDEGHDGMHHGNCPVFGWADDWGDSHPQAVPREDLPGVTW